MSKRVIVVASGETERRSLPHLLADLETEDIVIDSVRIPPGGRALNVEMAEKLVKSAWYENIVSPPDKFVILVDVLYLFLFYVGKSEQGFDKSGVCFVFLYCWMLPSYSSCSHFFTTSVPFAGLAFRNFRLSRPATYRIQID